MNMKEVLISFVATFVVTLVVTAIVTFFYSFIVHGIGIVAWETAFRLAIILGIVLTWTNVREKKKDKEGENKE